MRQVYFSVVFSGYLFISSLAQACLLTVHIMEFPPLAFKNDKNQWSGLNVDYIEALLDKVNCRFEFIEAPFARGLKLVKKGTVDMMVNISKIDMRENHYHFIGPQRIETIRLVSRKGSLPLVSSWHELAKLNGTLIRQRDAYIGKEVEDIFNNNNQLKERLMLFTDNEKRIEMIKKKRADGFFIEATYLFYQLKNNPDYQILEVHPIIISKEPVYYAFSKKSVHAEQLKKLNKAFMQLQQTAEFKDIEVKYSQF